MAWEERDNALHATFEFKDFIEAFGFMTAVAMIAEKQNHLSLIHISEPTRPY